MFRSMTVVSLLSLAAAGCATSDAAPSVKAEVGEPAPDFTLPDLSGTEHSLSTHRGKITVLEWFNPGCPFVKHSHGEGGSLHALAEKATTDGVVWLAINSGAEGKQGHGVETNQQAKAEWKMDHPVLLDESGEVGRAYGAETTPHMYVIDAEGTLVYRGAIDNKPLGKGDGELVNYVERALADLSAGKAVSIDDTKPYGCSVKYAGR